MGLLEVLFVGLSAKADDKYQYECPERQELHEHTDTHPHVQAVNQHLDKEGVLLDTDSKSSILKGVTIDNFTCSSLPERVHKSLKSIKNELKTADSFKKTASEEHSKDNSDQKTIIYNETGYHAHFILALSKTINNKLILIADDHSNGLAGLTPLCFYLSKSSVVY